jgi:3-phytase
LVTRFRPEALILTKVIPATLAACVLALLASLVVVAQPAAPMVRSVRATASLPYDADDPAIWVNRAAPQRSLIVGTMKVAAPNGALAVFGLDGHQIQLLKGPNRPNNVDIEYGLPLNGTPTDVAVLTEHDGRRLRAYAISPDGTGLRDVSGESLGHVLEGALGEQGGPMGIGLYRRPKDGAIFAIVSPKAGPKEGYLWQYQLADDGSGHVGGRFVRRLGNFSGKGEIEAVAVDDELGYVYYADEDAGIHKWHADPDNPDAARELAMFAQTGYRGDREGLGVYARSDGTGYIVSVDQVPNQSVFNLYRREGEPGRPHDHSQVVLRFLGGADSTDGLDVTSSPLGPDFPAGLLVAMNSRGRNFLLFNWLAIAGTANPPLPSSANPAIPFVGRPPTPHR